MSLPAVSVVIVSRHRPQALLRCLTGVAQLDYAPLEVVVVGCPQAERTVATRPDAGQIKVVPYDTANISAARNLGVAHAAGEIVAFLDDDAVPEPLWLRHLVQPFAQPDVVAAGGTVLGRNGISLQWGSSSVDASGESHPLSLDSDAPVALSPVQGRAIRTEGTNMAFRREVLADIGGFDPAFHYFLDETDLNMRIAAQGHEVAHVPLAVVHHGFAASALRLPDRAPRDLFEIGASKAVFLRKHCPKSLQPAAWKRFEKEQRLRCLRHMQTGALTPDDVVRLMRRLRAGYVEGQGRRLDRLPPIPRAAHGFRPFQAAPDAPRFILSGWAWHRRALAARAASLVGSGAIVSVYRFSPSALFHHVRFRSAGYWEQAGGLFGRSVRTGRLFRAVRLKTRVRQEAARVAPVRGADSGV
ncbi:glycosyltransferase [Mesobacterium sp. TK19101]|uniref:Glycosyltransferase n=1 Tax=Mesobacterium hydrothermale TaxID=3111907 RepID=A0ABU6HDX6_9RHOB|nr:glycosyltransferase [Mesobacterium sp. TK19101]MEC3860662.1 glycosyltransferase [Mesobacterium sp. TK19101]